MINWYIGWSLILAAFVTGAVIGLFFHREDFWGGYTSFRRRITRLGHIALAALGMMNVMYSYSTLHREPSIDVDIANYAFIVGGISMPTVCFLSAWKIGYRHLFFIPVVSLVIGAVQALRLGPP